MHTPYLQPYFELRRRQETHSGRIGKEAENLSVEGPKSKKCFSAVLFMTGICTKSDKTKNQFLSWNIRASFHFNCGIIYKTIAERKQIMNLLTLENVSKDFGQRKLLDHVDFSISEGEKIGLIGVNGTGKSTLLKLIMGMDGPDEGKVIVPQRVHLEYLSQNPEFDPEATVLEEVFRGNDPAMHVVKRYIQVLNLLAVCSADLTLQEECIRLGQQMDNLQAWGLESEARAILSKLGITDLEKKIASLSGGEKKRVALAGALINPADLLILDEPSNHIDMQAIDWLEQTLKKFTGALLMVTHDRYFLERVTNRIIELDGGNLYSYPGNYSVFLEKKLEREEEQRNSERKRQSLLRTELEWVRRGARARSTKQKARLERFDELQARKPQPAAEKMEMAAGASRLGKKVIEIENISKAYGQKLLISDFSYIVGRHDRIGIIGPNGSGKSTLLNLIAGRTTADRGNVEQGATVKIGYFTQGMEEIDPSVRVIDYIKETAEFIELSDGSSLSASQMLQRFLFPPSSHWTPLAKLSGGELRRLYLLKVLMAAPNVLLLDEPGNDLDITTLGLLEEYLDEFQGAVIAVSHDRYFLDRVAEKLLVFEEGGYIREILSYTDYLQKINEELQRQVPKEANVTKPEKKKERPERTVPKFSFKEQKEYEQIDEMIELAEQQLEEIQLAIDAASSDFEKLQELTVKQQEAALHLDYLMERWTYLNELAEEIANYKKKQLAR